MRDRDNYSLWHPIKSGGVSMTLSQWKRVRNSVNEIDDEIAKIQDLTNDANFSDSDNNGEVEVIPEKAKPKKRKVIEVESDASTETDD